LPKNPNALVWLDLETTGLDAATCSIIEVATIVTDGDLNIVEEGPDLVIHQPNPVLAASDPWCIDQHTASGLFEECRRSDITLAQAERRTLAFVKQICLNKAAPLCGNSICFDRRFLIRHMPKLNEYLSFRNVDVSSIKELVHRWFPGIIGQLDKKSTHRALDDIRESIAELRLYRRTVFREIR
jgi:oligoribonuclease